MARSSWLEQLQRVGKVDQLLLLTWEFLEQWSPLEIALLPPSAWPRTPRTVDDLVETALRLERIRSAYSRDGGPRELAELAAFFNQVSIRALQLQLRKRGEG